MERALELAGDHGGHDGRPAGTTAADRRSDAVGAWREAFLRAPYLRDTFVACGVISETFETAVTWDRFEEFHASVIEAARARRCEVCGGGPGDAAGSRTSIPTARRPTSRSWRPAPRGAELEQWDEIKAAASEA